MLYGAWIATLVCAALLVHETGHYTAARIAKLHRSGPIVAFPLGGFVLTALDEVPSRPRAAATIIAAGPIAGAVGAWVAAALYFATNADFWLSLANVSIWLNLINLLPVGVLDGGHLAAHGRVPPTLRLAVIVYAATTGVWTLAAIFLAVLLSGLAGRRTTPCTGAEGLALTGLILPTMALLLLRSQLP